jgi:hypothetical protein
MLRFEIYFFYPVDFTPRGSGMIMKACIFLLFFLWGMFWMEEDGFRMAAASEEIREGVEEASPERREADQTENAAHAVLPPWNVYFEWNEPGFSAGQFFKEIRTNEGPRMTSPFAFRSWQRMESEERYTLVNEGEKTLSEAGPKERSEPQRDWRGIGRDTAFFLGYQVVFAGFLYLLPESVTQWSQDDKKATVNKWAENVKNPVWDDDKWWINYLWHPYFGATYYIRARERGFGEFGSFWYSALLSALYEFGIEAFFEPPSYQDLIATPVGGILVGKYIFEPLRENIKAKAHLEWYDHATLILTDPLGAVNSIFERALGIQSDLRVQLYSPPRKQGAVPPADRSLEWQEVSFVHPHGVSIHLQVEWK